MYAHNSESNLSRYILEISIMKKRTLLSLSIGFFVATGIASLSAAQAQTNLALGKTLLFSPAPNYWATANGDTDATDLTDGKLGKTQRLWSDPSAVGWTYPGRVNLALDLGQNSDVDEIAIRLQNGGTVGTGIMFPGWVEAFVSEDGIHYAKVAEFSRWNPNDFQKFNITHIKARGNATVDVLRFQHLKTRGRYVGLKIYGSTITVSDEVRVLGTPATNDARENAGTPSGFSVSQPEVYFHKPYLELASNTSLPIPVGLSTQAAAGSDVTLRIDLPPGVTIPGGKIGGITVAPMQPKVLADGWNQYIFEATKAKADKIFGQVYMQAPGWKDGQSGELRYQFSSANWQSPQLSLPLRAVTVPAAPRLKNIMASLGWWDGGTSGWPDELGAFRTLGINTFNVFGNWMPKKETDAAWVLREKARAEGFFISNIDSPFHPMLNKHKNDKEIYDQFEDGTVGTHLCISYRGPFYQEEIQRFATTMAQAKPRFASQDIELWSSGPQDSLKCTRCQADFAASGLPTWEAWQEAEGKEMVGDLVMAARKTVKDAGGADFDNGMYDLRPGETYQNLFNQDKLYPVLVQHGQVSTYTSLQPDDLEFIGDQIREDRAKLTKNDLLPWITPGDAGTFSGGDFQWALLECYTNGARGVWSWSSRMWDSEDLIAYNKVIRAIAPLEDIIIGGELVGESAAVVGEGRISGIKMGPHMLLLAADYYGKSGGKLQLKLNLPAKCTIFDALSGESVQTDLAAGQHTISIPLEGQRARLLEVRPS
jgi:hypothetical protein